MMRRTRAGRFTAAAASGMMLAALLMATPTASAADVSAEIDVLSGPADLVSAGNALVAIDSEAQNLRILSAGEDLTSNFRADPQGRLVGLVDGLPLGASELVVESGQGEVVASRELVNHPRSGPVFSGPQHVLYCEATGLGALDEDCMTDEVVVQYRYRTTGGVFADHPADGSVPTDLATTTVDGVTVPYVYRLERGTINRSLYEIAILHEPGTPEPTPWDDTTAWNDKLVYTFGGACGVGLGQGDRTGGVENHTLLSAGYAVASGSLNVFATSCDDVVSAETAHMVKEHFVESYGAPRFTMGFGGSAGTMQQLLLSDNYPGILDGVIGQIGYPDERTTTVTGHDCRGLANYWNSEEGAGWTADERLAVTGHAALGTCNGFQFFDGVDDPTRGCPAVVPVEDRWSPSNPDGVRCTIADTQTNVYGVDDEGRGLRVEPDNVGVQYGLHAWQDGEISADQFLSLNAHIGGMDLDGVRTAERSEASVEAIERGFATGRFNLTTGGLAHIPIIEFRQYTDPSGDFHDSYRSAVLRERMLDAYGEADTHVSWRGAIGTNDVMNARAIAEMDEWLTNLEALGAAGEGNRAATIAGRPSDIEDGCFLDPETFVPAPLDYFAAADDNPCNAAFPFHADPRIVAGSPVTIDVLKCELTAPVRDDYPEMTEEEWQELNRIFDAGVCDYAEPSQGRVAHAGTWLNFGDTTRVEMSTPTVEGQPIVGQVLTANVEGVTGGASLSYRWFADGVAIDGATEAVFAPTPDEFGATITLRVSAAVPGLMSVTAVSDATAPVATADVRLIQDVPYTDPVPTDTRGNLLDLYLPEAPEGEASPLVIWTSGSAWFSDDGKAGAAAIAEEFIPRGFAVAGVSVRSSSQVQFPGQLHDVRAAIRWLRTNADEYGYDPDRIAIMGNSSGGWVAAIAATTSSIDQLDGEADHGVSSAVQASVPFFPPVDFLQLDAQTVEQHETYDLPFEPVIVHDDPDSPESLLVGCPIQECPEDTQRANPSSYVSGQEPPVHVFHGTHDDLLPPGSSRGLFDALVDAGSEATFTLVDGAGHTVGDIIDAESYTVYTVDADGNERTGQQPAPTWDDIEEFLRASFVTDGEVPTDPPVEPTDPPVDPTEPPTTPAAPAPGAGQPGPGQLPSTGADVAGLALAGLLLLTLGGGVLVARRTRA